MNTSENTIFVTGGSSGIGEALAQALHKLGNKVIIGGRREDTLKSICLKNSGMDYVVVDVANPDSVQEACREIQRKFPTLNCLINNAGIQCKVDFSSTIHDWSALTTEIDINLKGILYMTAGLLPIIQNNPNPTTINVSSGLAFVPLAEAPIYCATKSAVHSFTLSLRHQLKDLVDIIEIAPPAVRTELGKGENLSTPPHSLDVSVFTEKVLKELFAGEKEITVGPAKALKIGSRLAPKIFFSLVNKK